MTRDDFLDIVYEKHGDKYGLMPPPTTDKEGLDILIDHFLGDYYSVNPISREQFNTEAICRILEQYPGKKEKCGPIKRLIKRIKKELYQVL